MKYATTKNQGAQQTNWGAIKKTKKLLDHFQTTKEADFRYTTLFQPNPTKKSGCHQNKTKTLLDHFQTT
jgi:hypothetical protein